MEFKLDKRQSTNAVRSMLSVHNQKSMAKLAEEIDIKETTLREAIRSGSLRLRDFITIADTLGFTITVKQKEQDN